MANKPIKMELFKAGKQTDSHGNIRVWTNADIDKIVSNFDANDKVAACLGHPSTNEPAMGWFNKLWREGGSLFGELGDRVDEFNVMLKKKLFPRRSVSFDNHLNLKHVGFFGVKRVAIKGLENFTFSASETEIEEFTTIEFAEFTSFESKFGFQTIARLFTNLREKMIEKDGIEKTDDVIPKFSIESIERAGNQELGSSHKNEMFSKNEILSFTDEDGEVFIIEFAALADLINKEIDKKVNDTTSRADVIKRLASAAGITPSTVGQILRGEIDVPPEQRLEGFAKTLGISLKKLKDTLPATDGGSEMSELETAKTKIIELEGKNTEFSKTIETLGADIQTMKDEKAETEKTFAETREKEKKAEFSEYLDGLIKNEKMLPANKEANLTMLMDLDGKETLDYSEGDETKKKTRVDIFKVSLEGAGEVIQFSEFAKNDSAPERIPEAKLSKLTHERAKEKNISFSEAGDEIMAENNDIVLQANIQSEAGGK